MLRRIKREFSFLHGNILVLIISWVFFYFSERMFYPFLSLFLEALGASPFVIGLVGSIAIIALSLVQIPGSYIADRHGRRDIIVIMTIAYSLSFLFFIFAPDWRWVLIGMVIGNLCLIYLPALLAITADSIPPEKRGMGFALTEVIPGIPALASPIVAGFLINEFGRLSGFKIMYVIVLLCSLVAASIRALYLKETLRITERISLNELKDTLKNSPKMIVDAWKLAPKSLIPLEISLLIARFVDPIIMMFSVLYVCEFLGISEVEWGIVLAISLAVLLASEPLIGKAADIISRKFLILLGSALFIPSVIWFATSTGFVSILATWTMILVSGAMLRIPYAALRSDLTPRDIRGRIFGSINFLGYLVMIPAPMIGGFLYERISPRVPFIFCGLIEIVAFLLVLAFVKEPRKREV